MGQLPKRGYLHAASPGWYVKLQWTVASHLDAKLPSTICQLTSPWYGCWVPLQSHHLLESLGRYQTLSTVPAASRKSCTTIQYSRHDMDIGRRIFGTSECTGPPLVAHPEVLQHRCHQPHVWCLNFFLFSLRRLSTSLHALYVTDWQSGEHPCWSRRGLSAPSHRHYRGWMDSRSHSREPLVSKLKCVAKLVHETAERLPINMIAWTEVEQPLQLCNSGEQQWV